MQDDSSLEEVGTFLRERIDSFEQLEILLLISDRRDESWTAATLSCELRLDEGVVGDALDHLRRANLLDVRVGESLHFRYAPATPELAAGVDRLARAYRERRIEVLRLLSALAVERVRSSAIRLFADAFLIGSGKSKKGEKKDG